MGKCLKFLLHLKLERKSFVNLIYSKFKNENCLNIIYD